MQLDPRDAAQMWDLLRAAKEIDWLMRDRPLADYMSNRMLQLALERLLEIIGECARRVSATTRLALPSVPWSKMIGQRNVLAHEYGSINHASLWATAHDDIPPLIAEIEATLRGSGFSDLPKAPFG